MSLVIGLQAIGWGLPARFHPDEKADGVLRLWRSGSLAPESFINPSAPLYAMLPAIAAQDELARRGWLPEVAADPLLAGRALSVLAAAFAVVVAGLAAGRLGVSSARAALGLALMPGVVNLAPFATPEAWLLLASAGALLTALGHQRGEVPAWACGLAVGLAASTKYTAAALLVPALAAVLARASGPLAPRLLAGSGALLAAAGAVLLGPPGGRLAGLLRLADVRLLHPERAGEFVRAQGLALLVAGILLLAFALVPRLRPLARRDLVVVLACATLGFLIGTPWALVEPRAFLSDLAFNHQTRFEYKGLVGSGTSFGAYLGLLGDAATWPLLLLAGLGLLRALRQREWVLVLSALAPYALVAASAHRALRFVVPCLPALALLAMLGLSGLPQRWRRLAGGLVLLRAALAALLVARLFHVDSRLLAARYLEGQVPAGGRIDLISNSPGYGPAPRGREVRLVPTLSREMAPPDRFAEAARRYPQEAAGWLVLTASYYERFLDHPEQRPERARFFAELLAGRGGFEVQARFRQPAWLRPPAEFLDPEIVVLRKVYEAEAR